MGEAAPEQDETYERFWAQAWARIRRDWPSWPLTREPTSPSWLDTDSGLDGVALLMIFRSGDLEFQVYFGDPDERLNRARFAALTSVAHEFEAAVGIPLQWDAMEGRRAARIRTRSGRGYRVEDESRWGEMTDWLAEMQLRFRAGLSAIGWPDSFRGIIVSQAAPGELSRRRRDDAPV